MNDSLTFFFFHHSGVLPSPTGAEHKVSMYYWGWDGNPSPNIHMSLNNKPKHVVSTLLAPTEVELDSSVRGERLLLPGIGSQNKSEH